MALELFRMWLGGAMLQQVDRSELHGVLDAGVPSAPVVLLLKAGDCDAPVLCNRSSPDNGQTFCIKGYAIGVRILQMKGNSHPQLLSVE